MSEDGEEDNVQIHASQRSSVCGAGFNFINSIVGAGIIGIPFAIQQCGFGLGLVMLFFVGFLINRSLLMLIDCGIKCGKLDLEELTNHVLGSRGYFVALAVMFMFSYGAQIAYLIVVGDTVPLVAEMLSPGSLLANRTFVMLTSSTLIILPLCLMRDLSSLARTSFLSVMSVLLLIAIIAARAPNAARVQHIEKAPLSLANSRLFVGIATMSFAYVSQHNCFLVFRSLQQPTFANWKKVAHGSILFSLGLSLLIGLSGYLSFSEDVKADVLNNFPTTGSFAYLYLLNVCLFLSSLIPTEFIDSSTSIPLFSSFHNFYCTLC